MKFEELEKKVNAIKPRGAWARGVKAYAQECLDFARYCGVEDDTPADSLSLGDLVNHVGGNRLKIGTFRSADAYNIIKESSEGGNFEIYDGDIADKLCTKNEVKRMTRKDGTLRHPCGKSWIETQTRAIRYALITIQDLVRG